MYQDLFFQAGLNKNESIIYEYLLQNGQSSAMDISKKTPLKKGVVYVALNDLVNKGLVSEKLLPPQNPNVRNKKKIAYFSPEHPEKLRAFLQNRRQSLEQAGQNLDANIGSIISSFNLSHGRPGIRFFEGLSGVRQVIFDSLDAKDEIYTYVDAETVVKHINDINQEYVKERNKLGIRKKMILPDSDFSRKFLKDYHRQVTDVRLIDGRQYPFTTVMQIYSGKVSYVNFVGDNKIGIIIEDQSIYQMHRHLFRFTWERSVPPDF